jgi:RecA/RadA recombinase
MKEQQRQRSIQQQLAGMDPLSALRNRESLPTGFPALDAALGNGGLPRGGIVEIFGVASCGKTAFAASDRACPAGRRARGVD